MVSGGLLVPGESPGGFVGIVGLRVLQVLLLTRGLVQPGGAPRVLVRVVTRPARKVKSNTCIIPPRGNSTKYLLPINLKTFKKNVKRFIICHTNNKHADTLDKYRYVHCVCTHTDANT